jgi:hypothetical protein
MTRQIKPANDNDGSTALAPVSDELAEIELPEDASDGLGPLGPDDVRIAVRVFNFKGKDKDGRKIPEDVYYDTIDETTSQTIDAVLVLRHQTNVYSFFDNDEKKTKIVCRSNDQVTGTMDNGTRRPCDGCPDAVWHTDDKGKRQRCAPVYNMFALDRANSMPFAVRFKRSSLPVIQSYLHRHHFGRRVLRGERVNYPLYCFAVKLSLKLSDNGNYAIPVLERGAVLSQAEISACAEMEKTLREKVLPVLFRLEEIAEAHAGREDTSFDTDKMDAAAGQDFVESGSAG